MNLGDSYNTSELRPRAAALLVMFSIGLSILGLRLWYLQIWKGQDFREFSDKNRFRVERLAAPRGKLFDRNNHLLADSRPSFDITLTKGYTKSFREELQILNEVFQWTSEEYAKKINEVEEASYYQPVEIARDVSFDQLARLETRSLDLSGVHTEVVAVRDYLYDEAFFHVLGYMGELNELDLKRLQAKYPERNYRLGDQVGVIGVESLYERYLRGKDGARFTVVDVRGRKINVRDWIHISKEQEVIPEAGTSLKLSLDLNLQLKTVEAFEDHVGAAVAIDPQTGQILAAVSRPAINPNRFTRGMSGGQFKKLREFKDNPFLDRTVAEHYPPGSTYKLVMAAAALQSGVIDEKTTFQCPGYFRFGRRTWRCHKASGHGKANIYEAIKGSCDVFFYNVALLLGLDEMFSWGTRFGLSRRTYLGYEVFAGKQDHLIRFNSEVSGMLPNTAWVKRRRNTSIEGETINAGIGQGGVLTTAMQLARMVSIFGNTGDVYQPQIVQEMKDPYGLPLEKFSAVKETTLALDPKIRQAVLEGMRQVVNDTGGTGVRSRVTGINFGGKTGTAQVIAQKQRVTDMEKLDRDVRDHALFVGLAPIENPKIAVAVIVEHGGHGSRTAGPIAKQMVEAFLKKEEEKHGAL